MTDNEYMLSWQRGDKDLLEAVTNYRIFVNEIIERYKELKAENEEIWQERCRIFESLKEAKTQAYEEFAYRLKEKATGTFFEERKYVDTEDIDEVVAELTHHKETVSMIDGHIEE